jgi:hypothetical protein
MILLLVVVFLLWLRLFFCDFGRQFQMLFNFEINIWQCTKAMNAAVSADIYIALAIQIGRERKYASRP